MPFPGILLSFRPMDSNGEKGHRSTGGGPERPLVRLGWIVVSGITDPDQQELILAVIQSVRETLQFQFPQYRWETPLFRRPIYPAIGTLDPLPLLELGAEEKLHRHLDLAFVVVPNELTPRTRIFVTGVPSSPLETAVLSLARFMERPDPATGVAALALHLLGHLLGAEHESQGIMEPSADPDRIQVQSYSESTAELIRERLARIADARVEEVPGARNCVSFVWRTLRSDLRGIADEVTGNAPWRMPLQLGRYTAATAVTVVFLFLSAEAWELGAHLAPGWLGAGALLIVLLATLSLYIGQNFHQLGRVTTIREQLVRTRIVVFGSLLLGTAAQWLSLFLVALVVVHAFPREVFASWAGASAAQLNLAHYAIFMATLGVLAGAFGGNLEDESEIKAVLLFDEET